MTMTATGDAPGPALARKVSVLHLDRYGRDPRLRGRIRAATPLPARERETRLRLYAGCILAMSPLGWALGLDP
jgi:hypothetical protein